MTSENSKARHRLIKYCNGDGLDLGYGGDPMKPESITIDLPCKYGTVGDFPQNLRGDARKLYWFKDNVFDYVFSSHLLEDFPEHETKPVLIEWLRVLKLSGYLVLYLPNEQKFKAHCAKTGQIYNENHSIDMSLEFMKKVVVEMQGIQIVYSKDDCEDYSFDIVIQKNR